jgi:hypothetical protein
MVIKRIIILAFIFSLSVFLFVFFSPTQYFNTNNFIKEKLLISSLIRNVPDKKNADYYFYNSGDEHVYPNSSVYFCGEKTDRIEKKVIKYIENKKNAYQITKHKYGNKKNSNLFISIGYEIVLGKKCFYLSEYEIY